MRRAPDVVVTDVEMPGLSGLELAAELKRRGSTARVVILTTFARPGYLRRALEAGGHRPQLPVGGRGQAGRPQQGGRRQDRQGERVVVASEFPQQAG
jgi:two-component system, NarL family, response regulator DesR